MTDTPKPPAVSAPATNLPAPASLSPQELEQAMIAAGLISPASSGADFNRCRVDGQRFIFGDPKNPEFTFDSPSDGRPAFRCLLVSDAIEYNARWMDDTLATAVQRPHMAGKMCKTHIKIPEQAGVRAEDGTVCATCPVYFRLPKGTPVPADGNGIAKKCGGTLDVEFWLLDDNGAITDERIWTLSMSFTGLMEWQGSFSGRAVGYVSEANFKRKLAILAATKAPDNIAAAIVAATQALNDRGVIAEARILRAEREGNRFSVPSFNPIDIIATEAKPAIGTADNEGVTADAAAPDAADAPASDIPF